MQDEHNALDDVAKSQLGDRYGGVWISQRRGGKFIVASTGPVKGSERNAIARVTNHRSRVQFVRAPATAQEFEELSVRLRGMSEQSAAEIGAPVYLPDHMVIAVSATRSGRQRVEREFEKAVGQGLLEVTTVNAIDRGTEDSEAGTALNPVCTMGPWAFWQWGTLRIPAMTTAGHCQNRLRPTGSSVWFRIQAEDDNNVADVDPVVDAQVMVPEGANFLTNLDEPWASDQGELFGRIPLDGSVTPGGAFDRVGHMVCQSGKNSGVECGLITTTTGSCTTGLDHMAEYARTGGDSGAPVLSVPYPHYSSKIAGIHSGSTFVGEPVYKRFACYSFHLDVLNRFGLTGWVTQ